MANGNDAINSYSFSWQPKPIGETAKAIEEVLAGQKQQIQPQYTSNATGGSTTGSHQGSFDIRQSYDDYVRSQLWEKNGVPLETQSYLNAVINGADPKSMLSESIKNQTQVPDILNPNYYKENGLPMPTVTVTSPSNNTSVTPNGTTGTGTVSSDYQALLNNMYSEQQARAREQQALLAQQAQNAYNSNMASLANAYATRNNALNTNFNSAIEQLAGSYNQSRSALNQSAEDALREAYVNRMMSQRNLGQQLAANGLSGGASESAIANLLNQYGSNRNAISREHNNNLVGLENVYNQNLANAHQAYNDALAQSAADRVNYEMQLNNDLANNRVNSYADLYSSLANLDNNYLSNIGSLLANQQNYNQNLALQQAKTETARAEEKAKLASDWRMGYTQDAVNRGLSITGIRDYLRNAGATDEEIATIFTTIGVQ